MLNTITPRAAFERYLTEAEEKRIFNAAAKQRGPLALRDLGMMRLMRQTGIRVGSLVGLTVNDATEALRRGRLVIRRDIAKGGRAYEVSLNKEATRALGDLLTIRRRSGFRLEPDDPLILSRQNTPLTVRQVQRRCRHWANEAGLDLPITPHWFRHTLAKRMIARSTAQDPQRLVQLALGHHSRDSTAVYTMPDREEIAAAMEIAS